MKPLPERAWRRRLLLPLTLFGVVVTASLGVWQLDRAAQKRQLEASWMARATLPPLTASTLQAGSEQLQRQVHLKGHWLADRTVFLDNRPMNGRVGFFVLTPLQLEGRSDLILVQRGWQPRDAMDRRKLQAIPPEPGLVEVFGRLAAQPSRLYELGHSEAGAIRQNLDPLAYAAETGLALLPLTVIQAQDPHATPGLLRDWPAPTVDIHKHYGYAVQWFGLALLQIGLYVWFQLIRPRRQSKLR